jgi:hypothetical protein
MYIGDIKEMNGKVYFQANRGGTLVKLDTPTFWCKFWLQFRDCIKKWDMNEAIAFTKRCQKHRTTSSS